MRTVTLDMSQAYINSVKAHAPQAESVFDRFHVPEQRDVLKKTRFVLQKNPENL